MGHNQSKPSNLPYESIPLPGPDESENSDAGSSKKTRDQVAIYFPNERHKTLMVKLFQECMTDNDRDDLSVKNFNRLLKRVTKVAFASGFAAFSGKVYMDPSLKFVSEYLHASGMGKIIANILFVGGTMSANITLNYAVLLQLINVMTQYRLFTGDNLGLYKQATSKCRTFAEVVLSTLPASAMALLDYMGGSAASEGERDFSVIQNLLVYSALNLMSVQNLLKTFFPGPRPYINDLHDNFIKTLVGRRDAFEGLLKKELSNKGYEVAVLNIIWQSAEAANLLDEFMKSDDLVPAVGHMAQNDNSIGIRTTLRKFLSEALYRSTLAGYWWITKQGLQQFLNNELKVDKDVARIIAIAFSTPVVLGIYGSLMTLVVPQVNRGLRLKYGELREVYNGQRSMIELLPYSLAKSPLTSAAMGLQLLFAAFSIATTACLALQFNDAFYEYFNLDEASEITRNFSMVLLFILAIVSSVVAAEFNMFFTPGVYNDIAGFFNRNDQNQRKLNILTKFVDEQQNLPAETSLAILAGHLGLPQMGEIMHESKVEGDINNVDQLWAKEEHRKGIITLLNLVQGNTREGMLTEATEALTEEQKNIVAVVLKSEADLRPAAKASTYSQSGLFKRATTRGSHVVANDLKTPLIDNANNGATTRSKENSRCTIS